VSEKKPTLSDRISAALRKGRDTLLDQVVGQGSASPEYPAKTANPLEWLAAKLAPDYRSSNAGGIYSDSPEEAASSFAGAGPMKVLGRAPFRRITSGGLLDVDPAGVTRPGHGYRGITQAEMDFIDRTGGIKSNEAWSARGEGTNFAEAFEDAVSYANYGSTNPTTTGTPTYVVEVPVSAGLRRAPDGYLKTPAGVPATQIKRVFRFNPDGTVDTGGYAPPGEAK
jgi:hypothetical protein